MADGALTVKLSPYTARKLAAAAKASGLPPERLAAMMLETEFFDRSDFEWANGNPDDPLPPLNPNEPTYAWEDVKAEVRARLAEGKRRRA